MNVTSPSVTSGALLAGKYRVDRVIGEGGMGVVVVATNEALRQRVAIKLLRSGALTNAKALGRFEREARAAASLRSEHVARVLDVGKLEDGRPYMVMEYLEGRDLGDVIDHGPPMAVSEVVDYVLQACEAVAEAHAAGIVHRDLKPKNLFLAATVDGRPLVKVLDFGISKIEGSAEDMSLTRTTEIIGSPSYMSPEQLHASKDVDVRTDIWALGVILYELLTKKVPFVAMTVTQLVAVVLTEPSPDVRALRPDVPEGLALAIRRCLEKKRDDRFASVPELVHAIAEAGTGVGLTTAIRERVDRIARVAQGSGRLPPITGSGPYATVPPATGSGSNAVVTAGIPPSLDGGPPQTPRMHGNGYIPPVGPSGMPIANPGAPPPASSARLAIHGGTSVAWGETQVDAGQGRARPRRSMAPIIAAVALLVVVLGGAGLGGLFFLRRQAAPPGASVAVATAPPPPESASLPPVPGRHDLNPMGSAAPSAAASVETATGLPSGRIATDKPPPMGAAPHAPATGKPDPKADPRTAAKPPKTPGSGAATPAAPKPDDLDNIARH